MLNGQGLSVISTFTEQTVPKYKLHWDCREYFYLLICGGEAFAPCSVESGNTTSNRYPPPDTPDPFLPTLKCFDARADSLHTHKSFATSHGTEVAYAIIAGNAFTLHEIVHEVQSKDNEGDEIQQFYHVLITPPYIVRHQIENA